MVTIIPTEPILRMVRPPPRGKEIVMRRALMGTIAGWLVGAAGLLAQAPPPFPDDDRAPPRTNQRPSVSPYGQNSHSTRDSSHDDVPAFEEQRVQTLYR